jgi:hypothetical protein
MHDTLAPAARRRSACPACEHRPDSHSHDGSTATCHEMLGLVPCSCDRLLASPAGFALEYRGREFVTFRSHTPEGLAWAFNIRGRSDREADYVEVGFVSEKAAELAATAHLDLAAKAVA